MINKIKSRLRQWLFSEEIKELQSLHSQIYNMSKGYDGAIDKLREARDSYREAYSLLNESHKIVTRLMDIGVDIHTRNPYSWAVICIQGKPEYVKFMPLDHECAREIFRYLKQFEGSNMTIDSPYGYRDMMKDWFI